MLSGVNKMKRFLILIAVLVLILLLRLVFPLNQTLRRHTLRFLGVDRESVQTLGRSLTADMPEQCEASANP